MPLRRQTSRRAAAPRSNAPCEQLAENPTEVPVLLKAGGVAKMLCLTPKAVYAMAAKGELPGVIRLGRRVRFDKGTLVEWLSHKSSTVTERNA